MLSELHPASVRPLRILKNYTDLTLVLQRRMRSQELSEMSYGKKDVKFDKLVRLPPIAQRIDSAAQQRHANCVESWKANSEEDVELEEVYDEVE